MAFLLETGMVDGVADAAGQALSSRGDAVFMSVIAILFCGFMFWLNFQRDKKDDERRDKTEERQIVALEASAENGKNFSKSLDILASTMTRQAEMMQKQITLLENMKESHEASTEKIYAALHSGCEACKEYRLALLSLIRYAKEHVTTDTEGVRRVLEISEQNLMRIQDTLLGK